MTVSSYIHVKCERDMRRNGVKMYDNVKHTGCRNVQWQHIILATGLDHVTMLTLALKAPLLVRIATQRNTHGKRSILFYTISLKLQPDIFCIFEN